MPSNTPEGLRNYRKHLGRKPLPFLCIYCGIPVFAKEYELHCSRHHSLNSKSSCVWCCGTESWRSGEKHRHVDHLTACFDRFYDSRQDLTLARPRPIDSSPTCPEVRSFFDHPSGIRELLPPRAFQSIWPPDLVHSPPMTFQDETLNLAASHLQLYLETRDTHDWMHLMVKAAAFPSFLRALDRDDGGTRTSDFWCWCDGGRDAEDALRQHRHAIAVSEPPIGRFEREVWPRVRVDPSPRPNFPCKRIRKIESAIHLVNVLGYLSKRPSRCNFTRDRLNRPRNNHFYISKSLPKGYKLPLCTLWPGGVLDLLYQEKFQSVSVPRVIENPLIRNARRQWMQKVADFYNLERGLVIPVEKRFAPVTTTTTTTTTTTATPHFVHLTRDRKLYFNENPENETTNQAAWLQMQFERGNSFYDAVGEETWTPRATDQSRINDMMPLVEKIERLESENGELKNERDALGGENEGLKTERDAFKRKWEEEMEKCNQLSYKLYGIYEKENTKLKKLMEQCSNCRSNL